MQGTGLHPYEAAVLATVRRRKLLGPADRVLVALSAGPDSTALVAALAALRDAGEVAEVAALHVDHGLRAGGELDAACAREACERLRVPFATIAVQVRPGNLQAQARAARYAALRARAAARGATRIATGHTLTDQAETVLLRLLRGAGARGLGAIPPRRGLVIRPLLDRPRAEGIAYLADRGLRWREDPTNATPRFARNRIRHELLPALRALAPRVERSLARTADLSREDERALAARARRCAGDAVAVPLAALRSEPVAVRRRLVRRLFRSAGGRGTLEADHVAATLALTRRGRPGRVALPGGLEARCRYGVLEVVARPSPAAAVAPVALPCPGRYLVPERGVAVDVAVARPDVLRWPLTLRTRRPGDRFRGPGGTKKLKSWLIDRKVPREARDELLLVTSGGDVLALPAFGIVAQGLGPAGAGLCVRIAAAP